jgi:hypothetical protein
VSDDAATPDRTMLAVRDLVEAIGQQGRVGSDEHLASGVHRIVEVV